MRKIAGLFPTVSLALGVSAAQAAGPPGFGAAQFDGYTYLLNIGGVVPTVSDSYGGTAFYYYNSDFQKNGGIFSEYPSAVTNSPGIEVRHMYFPGDGVRLELHITNASVVPATGPYEYFDQIGDTLLPYDGQFHSVFIRYDIAEANYSWELDGIEHTFASIYSSMTDPGGSFKINYAPTFPPSDVRWFVGGNPRTGYSPFFTVVPPNTAIYSQPVGSHYKGTLSSVYFHIGDDDYNQSVSSTRVGLWFGLIITPGSPPGVLRNAVLPYPLGPLCAPIFGPGSLPALCLRGPSGAPGFANNASPYPYPLSNFTVSGALTDAPADEYSLYSLLPPGVVLPPH